MCDRRHPSVGDVPSTTRSPTTRAHRAARLDRDRQDRCAIADTLASAMCHRPRGADHRGPTTRAHRAARLAEALALADNRVVAILRGLAKPVRYLTLLAG